MKKKKRRRQQVDLDAARALRDKSMTFSDEFDASAPEEPEVKLDTPLSALLDRGQIKTKKKGTDLYLDDVLVDVLGRSEDDKLIEDARLFRVLISSYGGEPTDEDMDEAYDILTSIVEALNGIEGIGDPHGQAKIAFD